MEKKLVRAFLHSNAKEGLQIIDDQYDGEQYFMKVNYQVANRFTFRVGHDFNDEFPDLNLSEGDTKQIKLGFIVTIEAGLGYYEEDGRMIYDKDPDIHYYRFDRIQSHTDHVTDEQLIEFVDNSDATQKEILEENAEAILNFNDFSVE